MGKLRKFLRDVRDVPYSVKNAKKVSKIWGIITALYLVQIGAIVMLLPGFHPWRIGYHVLLLAFAAFMLRYSLMKLADAQGREENREWVKSMYEQWSR